MCVIGALVLISILDDSDQRRRLADLIRHAPVRPPVPNEFADLLLAHGRVWIAAVALFALVLRWVPLRVVSRWTGGDVTAASGADARSARYLHPVAVGLAAIQLAIGGAFLTAHWIDAVVARGTPIPKSDDEIRATALGRDIVVARHLERILPPDADLCVVPEWGATPVFLNYFLHPRRLYAPPATTAPGSPGESPAFWVERRREGHRWVLLYNPISDKAGWGHLIELPPSAAASPASPLAGGADRP